MSETKHTPGPWTFIDATKVAAMQFKPLCVIRSEKQQVASVSWNDGSPHFPTKLESQANARLIAAAPDLLAALSWFINDIDDTHTVMLDFDENVALARAAIAKAGGQS